jgi:hypothetical protein
MISGTYWYIDSFIDLIFFCVIRYHTKKNIGITDTNILPLLTINTIILCVNLIDQIFVFLFEF